MTIAGAILRWRSTRRGSVAQVNLSSLFKPPAPDEPPATIPAPPPNPDDTQPQVAFTLDTDAIPLDTIDCDEE